jgi:signal transduction histidine kinase
VVEAESRGKAAHQAGSQGVDWTRIRRRPAKITHPANPRARRGARATGRDRRSAEGHQSLDIRLAGGAGYGGDYEPILAASTKNLGDRVEITIRDNGTGITPDVKDKMFNPFFSTKPTGQGTGLGLSISHDIIVKQHGGSIEVDSAPGEFTEIRITLLRAADFVVESGKSA